MNLALQCRACAAAPLDVDTVVRPRPVHLPHFFLRPESLAEICAVLVRVPRERYFFGLASRRVTNHVYQQLPSRFRRKRQFRATRHCCAS